MLTFNDARLLDGRLVDVTVGDGRITAVVPAGEVPATGDHVELDGHVLIPGLWCSGIRVADWAVASRSGHAADELDTLSDDAVDGWVHEAGEAAAARGLVGAVDLGPASAADAWLRRFVAGFDELRIAVGIGPERLEPVIAAGLTGGSALHASGLLTLGPLVLDPGQAADEALLRRARSFGLEIAVEAGDADAGALRHAFAAAGARGAVVPLRGPADSGLDPWPGIAAEVAAGRTPEHGVAASARTRIAVGEPADLVVLAADPREAGAAGLREQPVAATMVAGRFSYDAIR
jgi:hypothetical protein